MGLYGKILANIKQTGLIWENIGQYEKRWTNTRKYWPYEKAGLIQENIGQYEKSWAYTRKYWLIHEKTGLLREHIDQYQKAGLIRENIGQHEKN